MTAFVFVAYIILNIIFYYQFNKKVGSIDEEYMFWKNLHPKTASFILILTRFLSFKMIRLKYSYLYGFDNFKSRFQSPNDFCTLMKRFTWAHIIICNCVIIGIDAYSLIDFSIDSQIKINMIETAVISLFMMLVSFIEFRKMR